MTETNIRIGHLAIDGLAHAPSEAAFTRRLQAAIGDALRRPAAGIRRPLSLPQLRITLPHGASERDVAAAVANALRDTDPEYRRLIRSVP
jgi:hypothetical protein